MKFEHLVFGHDDLYLLYPHGHFVQDVGSKSVHDLSHFYTNVPPFDESIKKSSVSATIDIFLKKMTTSNKPSKNTSGLIMQKSTRRQS